MPGTLRNYPKTRQKEREEFDVLKEQRQGHTVAGLGEADSKVRSKKQILLIDFNQEDIATCSKNFGHQSSLCCKRNKY